VAWLETRATNNDGKIDEDALQAIRRGCYLGKVSFKDRLLKLIDKSTDKAPSGRSRTGGEIRDHGEKDAAPIVRQGMKELGAPSGIYALAALSKSDKRKILFACLLRDRTSVRNHWITSRLSMGHSGSVTRLISCGVILLGDAGGPWASSRHENLVDCRAFA
jgi:hypothetical protein